MQTGLPVVTGSPPGSNCPSGLRSVTRTRGTGIHLCQFATRRIERESEYLIDALVGHNEKAL